LPPGTGLLHVIPDHDGQQPQVARSFCAEAHKASSSDPQNKRNDGLLQRLTSLPGLSKREAPAEIDGLLHEVLATLVGLELGLDPVALDQGGFLQEIVQLPAEPLAHLSPRASSHEGTSDLVAAPNGTQELVNIVAHLTHVQPALNTMQAVGQSTLHEFPRGSSQAGVLAAKPTLLPRSDRP
jgi:hypothetical protein